MTARATLALVVALLSGCARGRPCAGYVGTCVELEVHTASPVAADQLAVDLSGAVFLRGLTPDPAEARIAFPVRTALELGSVQGDLAITVSARDHGVPIAESYASARALTVGEHRTVVVTLGSTAEADGGRPSDLGWTPDLEAPPDGAQGQTAMIFVSSQGVRGGFKQLTCDAELPPSLAGRRFIPLIGTAGSAPPLVRGRTLVNARGEPIGLDSEVAAGKLQRAVDRTATGELVEGCVWTGFSGSGSVDSANDRCLEWASTNSGEDGRVGRSDRTDGRWLREGLISCDTPCHFYCLEE